MIRRGWPDLAYDAGDGIRKGNSCSFSSFLSLLFAPATRLGQTDFHSVLIKNPSFDHDYPAQISLFSNGMLGSGYFRGNFEIVD